MASIPQVSVIIAARNVDPYVGPALRSAQMQTIRDLEIIVVDDASSDRTAEIVREMAADDRRICIVPGPNRGPAAARNVALAVATGEWIAVLDGDDVMHPRRIDLMLDLARRKSADVVIDNALAFQDDPKARCPYLVAAGPAWAAEREVGLVDYILSNGVAKDVSLGYLKPLLRRTFLPAHGIRYDEAMRIGEDYDFIAQVMSQGARLVYSDKPLYFYRRHRNSISYRIRTEDARALLVAALEHHEELSQLGVEVGRASNARINALRRSLEFTELYWSLKERRFGHATGLLASTPRLTVELVLALMEGASRRKQFRSAASRSEDTPRLVEIVPHSGESAFDAARERVKVGRSGRIDRFSAQDLLALAETADNVLNVAADEALRDFVPYLLPQSFTGPGAHRREAGSPPIERSAGSPTL